VSTAPLVVPLAPAPSALAELAAIDAGLDDPRRLIDGGGIRAEAMALVAPAASIASLIGPRVGSSSRSNRGCDASQRARMTFC